MTSSKTGTLPPTSPVFPPWGTTAKFLELQYLRIWDTCRENEGRNIILPPNCNCKYIRQNQHNRTKIQLPVFDKINT